MKKTNKLLLLLATAFTAVGVTAASMNTGNAVSVKAAATSLINQSAVNAYYSGISDSLTGNALRSALNALNSKKRTKTVGYKQHRNYYYLTEVDPNGTTPSGKMYGFYDNALVSNKWDNQATWNHEHVWPNSLGGGTVDGDIHMPRPTSVKINSSRGNKYYAETKAYDPGQYVKNYRGIAARIIFYSAIANTSLNIIDAYSGGSNQMGKLSDLLKWNLEYLPNTTSDGALELRIEQNRNNKIESNIQGNRNPFIDHPEYACKIWGDANANTKAICKNNVSGGGGNTGGNTGGDEGQTNSCQGSIVGASSVALSVSALAGFLFFNKKRKETEEEK